MYMNIPLSLKFCLGKYLPIGYEPIIKNIKFIKAKQRTISVEVGTNITTVAGNSILLICPVGKYGKVDIIWEKEGLFFQGTRYYTNGTVFISSLKVKDSGSYTCFSDDARKWKFGSLHISVLSMLYCIFLAYFVRPFTVYWHFIF